MFIYRGKYTKTFSESSALHLLISWDTLNLSIKGPFLDHLNIFGTLKVDLLHLSRLNAPPAERRG